MNAFLGVNWKSLALSVFVVVCAIALVLFSAVVAGTLAGAATQVLAGPAAAAAVIKLASSLAMAVCALMLLGFWLWLGKGGADSLPTSA